MLRHVVLFRWTDDTTADDVDQIDAGLASLPGLIPEVRSYTYGRDLRVGEETWDYGVVADFDDEAGWKAYDVHPEHNRVRSELIGPHRRERATVRFEL
jgi:Stress responsive A/B Barrel Domain